jgi:hypothetical protein
MERTRVAEKMEFLDNCATTWSNCTLPFHRYEEREIAIQHAIKTTLPEMRLMAEGEMSVREERYYHQFAFHCAFHEGDILTAQRHWLSLSEVVTASNVPSGETKFYLAAFQCLLLCHSDELGLHSLALYALENNFKKIQGAGISTIEQLYFLARSKGLLDVAFWLVDLVLDFEIIQDYPEIVGRWTLYKASIFFSTNQPDACFTLLRRTDLPFRRLDGALISSGILELMCLIEMEHDDGAENRIEALTKMVRRRKSDEAGIALSRVNLMVKALRSIIQEAYDFDAARIRCETSFIGLVDPSKENEWDEFGQEVINFGAWLRSHLKSKANVA